MKTEILKSLKATEVKVGDRVLAVGQFKIVNDPFGQVLNKVTDVVLHWNSTRLTFETGGSLDLTSGWKLEVERQLPEDKTVLYIFANHPNKEDILYPETASIFKNARAIVGIGEDNRGVVYK